MTSRRFEVFRPNLPATRAEQGKAPEPGKAAIEGVIFTDGTVVIQWRSAHPSTSVFASWGRFMAAHGHPEYGTTIVWLDESPLCDSRARALCEPAHKANCRQCHVGYHCGRHGLGCHQACRNGLLPGGLRLGGDPEPDPDDDRARADLQEYLDGLYRDANLPSLRKLADAIGSDLISHSTIGIELKDATRTRWPKLRLLVEHLGGRPDVARELWMKAQQAKL